eukprot:362546-Chlamydomonas_euryale.AAC.4
MVAGVLGGTGCRSRAAEAARCKVNGVYPPGSHLLDLQAYVEPVTDFLVTRLAVPSAVSWGSAPAVSWGSAPAWPGRHSKQQSFRGTNEHLQPHMVPGLAHGYAH